MECLERKRSDAEPSPFVSPLARALDLGGSLRLAICFSPITGYADVHPLLKFSGPGE